MPPSHCREFFLRTNTNWHSLHIAQHRIDSNYFVLFAATFELVRRPIRMVWNVPNIRIGPANRSPFVLRRTASPNVVSIRVSSYWFVSHRCTFVSIRCTFALGFAACLLQLSTLQYDAQRSHCRTGSHMFALVRVSSYQFLSCSHHIIAQSYWFSITTVLLRIASCRHCVASYCISLHRINSCWICVWFANNHLIKSFWFGIEVDPVRTPNF